MKFDFGDMNLEDVLKKDKSNNDNKKDIYRSSDDFDDFDDDDFSEVDRTEDEDSDMDNDFKGSDDKFEDSDNYEDDEDNIDTDSTENSDTDEISDLGNGDSKVFMKRMIITAILSIAIIIFGFNYVRMVKGVGKVVDNTKEVHNQIVQNKENSKKEKENRNTLIVNIKDREELDDEDAYRTYVLNEILSKEKKNQWYKDSKKIKKPKDNELTEKLMIVNRTKMSIDNEENLPHSYLELIEKIDKSINLINEYNTFTVANGFSEEEQEKASNLIVEQSLNITNLMKTYGMLPDRLEYISKRLYELGFYESNKDKTESIKEETEEKGVTEEVKATEEAKTTEEVKTTEGVKETEEVKETSDSNNVETTSKIEELKGKLERLIELKSIIGNLKTDEGIEQAEYEIKEIEDYIKEHKEDFETYKSELEKFIEKDEFEKIAEDEDDTVVSFESNFEIKEISFITKETNGEKLGKYTLTGNLDDYDETVEIDVKPSIGKYLQVGDKFTVKVYAKKLNGKFEIVKIDY